MMIDTHCHLDIDDYEHVEEVIKHMDGNIMIASGCNLETSKRVIELVNKYALFLFSCASFTQIIFGDTTISVFTDFVTFVL